MSITVNNVLRMKMQWMTIDGGEMFINNTNWRVHSGELADEKASYDAIRVQMITSVWDKYAQNLPDGVSLREISLQIVAPTKGPSYFTKYGPTDHVGGIDSEMTAINLGVAATLTRASYRTGRKSYGRNFFGPLDPVFLGGSDLTIDPLGSGDLRDVLSALFDPKTITSGTASIVLRPCICPASPGAIDSTYDVRLAYWQTHLSYLRTRKPGRGG